MTNTTHTPGPLFVGAQNDASFLVAGRAPAPSNDYPWHDAPRVAVAKLYGPTEGDCLPVDADKNGALLAAAYTSYDKHCGPNAIAAAEGDLLGEALDSLAWAIPFLQEQLGLSRTLLTDKGREKLEAARAVLAKAGKAGAA